MTDNSMFEIERDELVRITSPGPGGRAVIPEGVRRIRQGAFGAVWNSITSLVLPESLVQLDYPLVNMKSLREVTLPDHLEELPAYLCAAHWSGFACLPV